MALGTSLFFINQFANFSHIQGTSFFSPVIGGWVADTFLGRYNTIYGSSLLYLVGTIVLAAVTFDYGTDYGLNTQVVKKHSC